MDAMIGVDLARMFFRCTELMSGQVQFRKKLTRLQFQRYGRSGAMRL